MLSLEMKKTIEDVANNGTKIYQNLKESIEILRKASENITINIPKGYEISARTGADFRKPEPYYSSEYSTDDLIYNVRFIIKE